jgi:hypothetical protein
MRTAQNIPEALLDVLQDALDRPIAFHRVFVKLTGSVTAALMLSQAVYWTKRANSGGIGWFYKTITQWEEETGLSRHEQETSRKALRRFSFWQEKRRGIPAQMYYHVDIQSLSDELIHIARSPIAPKTSDNEDKKEQSTAHTRLPESGKLDCGKTANKNPGKRQTGMPETGRHYITETTTEITTETTTETTPKITSSAAPLTPSESVHGNSMHCCSVVKKRHAGFMQNRAGPERTANVPKKLSHIRDDVEKIMDVLNYKYQQSIRNKDEPLLNSRGGYQQ